MRSVKLRRKVIFHRIHFKVHSYNDCHLGLCISSEEKSNLGETIKSGSCKHFFFFSFAIIIAFLSVIESQAGSKKRSKKNVKFFLAVSNVSRLFMNSQSVYCHRSESDKVFLNSKNFFRNKSMTRFMNSRFGVFFDVSQSHFNLNSWFPPFFSVLFSIILTSLEMISWLDRTERRRQEKFEANPESDEIE